MKKKISVSRLIFGIFCWVYALFSLYPMIWMLFYSFKNNDEIFRTNPFCFPTHLRVENYINAWTNYDVPTYFGNSLLVSFVSVVLCLVCALPFAYATSRMTWKLKGLMRSYLGLGLFIPVQAIMIPLVKVVQKFNLLDTRWSLILPYVAMNLAFATMVYYGFFKGIPLEMEEASCMDGASIYTTFLKVICPMVRPATVTLVIYIFLSTWNEFVLANVLVGSIEKLKTLPLGVLFFQGQFTTDWGGMGATMVIASLPAVLLYCCF